LSAILLKEYNYNEAKTYIMKALAVKPNLAILVKNAGIVSEKTGQKEKAFEYYTKYLSLNPAGNDVDVVRLWIKKLQ